MADRAAETAARRATEQMTDTIARLSKYLEIPAISCEPAHASDVRRLAEQIARDLSAIGLHQSRVLDVEGALPLVAAEWLGAGPDKPTVLIYGHMDLQPVAGEAWDTPAHTATVRGDRMYARGAADDMGGWVSHLGAIRAWMETAGGLPCNVRLVIEGEEEIGSPNLEKFMDAYPGAFEADVMILTDCENPSTEVPGLTVSLRGLLEVVVTCRALSADGHSGLWGNLIPDVSIALVKLVNRLVDDDGRMTIGRVDVPEAWRAAVRAVPFDDLTVREGAHLLDGVNPLPERDRPAAEWMWRQPAVTIVATTLPTPERKKNALRAQASATLSIRVPPGTDPQALYAQVREVLLAEPPCGVLVDVAQIGWASEGWLYEPKGPAFAAADRAYQKAWGKPMVQIGVGGTIPFVALFGKRYGDLPLILNGVMDPRTTAHGPNESLHLGVFRKAVLANVHLYDELGALGRDGIR